MKPLSNSMTPIGNSAPCEREEENVDFTSRKLTVCDRIKRWFGTSTDEDDKYSGLGDKRTKQYNQSVPFESSADEEQCFGCFDQIPVEVFCKITSYLPKEDFDSLLLTCRSFGFHNIAGLRQAYLESFLKGLVHRYYGDIKDYRLSAFKETVTQHFESHMDEAISLCSKLIPVDDFPLIEAKLRHNSLYTSSLLRMFSNCKNITQMPVKILTDTGCIHSISLMPNGWLATGSSAIPLKILMLNQPNGEINTRNVSGITPQFASILSVFSNGKIAYPSEIRSLKILDLNQGYGDECIKTLSGCCFFHDCNQIKVISNYRLVMTSASGKLMIVDFDWLRGQERIRVLQHSNRYACYFSHVLRSGELVSYGYSGKIKIWDLNKLPDNECVKTLAGCKEAVKGILTLGDNQFCSWGYSHQIKIWDMDQPEGNECLRVLKWNGGTWGAEGVVILPNGQLVSAHSKANSLMAWDLDMPPGEELVRVISTLVGNVNLQLVPDGRLLVLTTNDRGKHMMIFDLSRKNGKELVSNEKLDTEYNHFGPLLLQLPDKLSQFVCQYTNNHVAVIDYYYVKQNCKIERD